ncbi:hypothetical protein TNIN_333361 [Trichonephila inaurata madagascariensis]|uniref:Uncharacterized protein n=1 Tax=Trichonephila inaurata madagascariensis TaxID=2747483 RepID=A0A8X7BWH1_9ARAC|nr:hypothetical protein TNIN_333361 [Trichonephila inaurata madagascariensis]
MTTKLIPSLEEMALLKVAVTIYSKLQIKKSEKGVRRVLSGTPDDELPIIKEAVPMLEIPKCFQDKLKNIITLLSFERYRHRVEKRLRIERKYSQGEQMASSSKGSAVVRRTSNGKNSRKLRKYSGTREQFKPGGTRLLLLPDTPYVS